MQKSAVNALVVDPHALSACGIVYVLEQFLMVSEVGVANDVAAFQAALRAKKSITLLAINPALLGLDGLHGVRSIRQNHPSIKVILISDELDVGTILESIAAGIHGYIPKSLPIAKIADAIRTVLNGGVFVPHHVSEPSAWQQESRTQAPHRPEISLTARQKEVLDAMSRGRSNKEIADTLKISESTVKVHLATIFRALKVHNRVGALAAIAEQKTEMATDPGS